VTEPLSQPENQSQRRTTPWQRPSTAFLAAVLIAAVAGIGGAYLARRNQSADNGARRYEHTFAKDYLGTINIGVSAPEPSTQISVEWGQLRTSFEHTGSERKVYFFERGVLDERQAPLVVTSNRPVKLDFAAEPAGKEGIDIGATPWQPLLFSPNTLPPRPASNDSPTATASVVETVSYGGPVPGPGIGVLERPNFGQARLDDVHHGEMYPASCWATGDVVTNSNYGDPSDDLAAYTSPIWWYIETKKTTGFVSDVWFARRGNLDKLNLPECAPTVRGEATKG
jgi:hypothetical protein